MSGGRRGKRCVCGRSGRMPLCDGSHRSEGWECSVDTADLVRFAFAANDNLRNLADRLAHRFKGQSLQSAAETIRCERLVLVTDGQDVDVLRRIAKAVQRVETLVLCIGMAPSVLGWAFPEADCVGIEADSGPLLWSQVEDAVAQAVPAAEVHRPRVFLSHSVQDEESLFPIIDALRDHFGLELFVCADSIPSGSGWHEEIRRQVEGCDLFLFISSAAAASSSFCAFEAGIAFALNKSVHVLSLDGTPPPLHLQSIHAIDVERLQARKPWLTHGDALLEACLTALSPASSGSGV